ncbi:MAG: hypothetical protein RID53_04275 [Coleofasciculus sp. B1-GNL1-01]|uniref:hypothetical protein n=1 Tax=Coleofasciculus sp. B1-GNL1-01 TaxID=3068484 RepID=UPI003301B64B
MTRKPHDQFAKQYLEELLAPLGSVETSREISPEIRQVDVWFVPTPSPSTAPENLGLLGRMAATACLLEPFRNAPSPSEVLDCQSKLNSVRSEMRRKARREGTSFREADWPNLWILSPSCSTRLLDGFGARLNESENWGEGVYFLPEFQKSALIAINQLPVTEDTLWLRVLGKRGTQRRAIDELVALPQQNPFRQTILEILANWRITVNESENLSEQDRELLMNLSPAYLKWQEETLQQGKREGIQEGRLEGIQEGRLEGQRQMAENFLRVRFGELDPQLSGAIAPMLQLPPPELTRLLFNLSREELLVWFGNAPWQEDTLSEGRREIVENFLRVRFGELDQELSSAIAPMLQLPPQELTSLLTTLSGEQLLERFGESSG